MRADPGRHTSHLPSLAGRACPRRHGPRHSGVQYAETEPAYRGISDTKRRYCMFEGSVEGHRPDVEHRDSPRSPAVREPVAGADATRPSAPRRRRRVTGPAGTAWLTACMPATHARHSRAERGSHRMWERPEQRDVDPMVEVAGIEPASDDENPGLLRVQCAKDFLGPRARAHTFSDRPSRVGCPAPPLGKAAQLSFLADARD